MKFIVWKRQRGVWTIDTNAELASKLTKYTERRGKEQNENSGSGSKNFPWIFYDEKSELERKREFFWTENV